MNQPRAFHIRINPQSPLLLGNQTSISNFQESEDYIPGSALAGAVGARLLAGCTAPEHQTDHASCPERHTCPFWHLFGPGQPQFGFAYPGASSHTFPYPLTARSCKRHPAYSPHTGLPDQRHHGARDILLASFAYELVSDPAFPHRAALQPDLGADWSLWSSQWWQSFDQCHAPGCQESLDKMTGYYQYAIDQGNVQVYGVAEVDSSRATHVGINRARGVAEESLLFTQDSLDAQGSHHSFHARVVLAAAGGNQEAALRQGVVGAHQIGRGRSRGYGDVEIGWVSPSPLPALSRRIERFAEAVADAFYPYAQEDKRIQASMPGHFFSLTLRSPAILVQGGQPQRLPDLRDLQLPEELLLMRAWARMQPVGGWDQGLPRRTSLAVNAGSVYLYYAPPTVSLDALLPQLETLELTGVGAEREQGYGEVTVCTPFHYLSSLTRL